jgi:hypothetical protein
MFHPFATVTWLLNTAAPPSSRDNIIAKGSADDPKIAPHSNHLISKISAIGTQSHFRRSDTTIIVPARAIFESYEALRAFRALTQQIAIHSP